MGSEFIVPVGSVIKEYLDEYGITQKDLSVRMGMSEKQISKFMTSKSRLTEDVAIRLEKIVPNLSASVLLKYESKYREYLAREKNKTELQEENLSLIAEKFHFKEVFKNTDYDIVRQAQEMLKILKIASFDNFSAAYAALDSEFMEDGGEKEAIAVWMGLCEEEIEIQNDELAIEYKSQTLKNSLPSFKALARSEDITGLTKNCRKLCNKLGIYLVFQKPISNCKVRGALTSYKGHPAIFISGRFKTHDNIWFAFIHEIGHLLLHYDQHGTLISMENENCTSEKEQEANEFARNFFIPQKNWDDFVASNKEYTEGKIKIFAKQMKIHPGIVVARLQHEDLLSKSKFNNLKVKIDYELF